MLTLLFTCILLAAATVGPAANVSMSSTFIGVEGPSPFAEQEAYRINWHGADWKHGWPLTFLCRRTEFRPADPDFNPMDEKCWALHRGIVVFNVWALLIDVAILVVPGAILAVLALAFRRMINHRTNESLDQSSQNTSSSD
ncbi:MAG TPA: hypothetical protein PLN21_20980 [Gemmatales bacterium]|nr:hypothetical protein [Gemmatales bacterium]